MSATNSRSLLFSKQRDYNFISGIERDFFKELAKKSGNFQGREIPGDSSLTVAAALNAASPFMNSKQDSLNVIVSFDITDCRERVDLDHMYLGTELVPAKEQKNRQVTHFIALTKGDSCRVKLHIDLDFDIASEEPKPSPHLQIGGRELKSKKKFSLSWEEGLDKPRWPSMPFCTPLLWHSAFLEFQECASVKPFVSQTWWRNIVKNAELALWKDFADDMIKSMGKSSIIEALYPPKC